MNDDTRNVDELEKEDVLKDEEVKEDKQKSLGKPKKNKKEEELEEKVKDLENQLLRTVADYRNLEKRMEEERHEFVKFANRDLLIRLIPAFDTLFLAEKYVKDEGIKLTIDMVRKALKEVGVEEVKTVGQEFDPKLMEAVTTTEGEENKVIEAMMPGYMLNGKLIRPAQVKVGKGQV